MEEMSYTPWSRKSWASLRKLGAAQRTRSIECVTVSDITNLLFKTFSIKSQKYETAEVRKKLTEVLKLYEEKSVLMAGFTTEQVRYALKIVKNGKAAGRERECL